MKIKVKKILNYFLLLICSSYICTSFFLKTTYYKFDSKEVKNFIEELTSSQCDGRLTGSPGNNLASEMIENSFKKHNLSPYNNSYRDSFIVNTPCKNYLPAKLIVNDSHKIIHEYTYGLDFKEDLISFKTSSIVLNHIQNVDIFIDSFIITQDNHKYLFKVNTDNFNFRSSFNPKCAYDFCINITNELYNEILDDLNHNYFLTINVPYTVTSKNTSNIIGVIKGSSDTLPPLILTAHYDHLGSDALNKEYNGALDNASGTAFILELSKNLSSIVKPKRDIIFIAFTGEEIGLVGSKNFVKSYYENIKDSTVINFDMIGSSASPIVLMNGKDSKDCEVSKDIQNICLKQNTNFNLSFQNSSDHASFTDKGINAITICHADFSRIHTPSDTLEHIDISSINDVYSIIQKEILAHAYNRYDLIFYDTKLLICVGSIFILILIYDIFIFHKNKQSFS